MAGASGFVDASAAPRLAELDLTRVCDETSPGTAREEYGLCTDSSRSGGERATPFPFESVGFRSCSVRASSFSFEHGGFSGFAFPFRLLCCATAAPFSCSFAFSLSGLFPLSIFSAGLLPVCSFLPFPLLLGLFWGGSSGSSLSDEFLSDRRFYEEVRARLRWRYVCIIRTL